MAAASGRQSVSSLQKHTWISWLFQTQQSSKRLHTSREQHEKNNTHIGEHQLGTGASSKLFHTKNDAMTMAKYPFLI
jgi:hypothetical protein